MAAKLIDVAREAGVAKTTASGILNNRQDSWASKETRERVLLAAKKLDYHPNRAAIGLTKGKFNTIGLLIPDLVNPFFAGYAQCVSDALLKEGYDLLIEDNQVNLTREVNSMERLISHQVDGIICFLMDTYGHDRFFRKQSDARFPIVFAGPGRRDLPVDIVDLNFAEGMTEVIQHLYQLGHRDIAWVWGMAKGQNDGQRINFLKKVMLEQNMIFREDNFIECGHRVTDAKQAFERFLQSKSGCQLPTAVVALNDWLALGVMRAASEFGLRVPQDISLVGVDNTEMGRHLTVALTTVSIALEESAREAAALILRRLRSEKWLPYQTKIFPSKLIIRESTSTAPKRKFENSEKPGVRKRGLQRLQAE